MRRPHLQLVEQFDARDRNAGLDGCDRRVAAASTDGNGQTPAEIASGMPVELQRQLGDDAERAFGADEAAA